MSSTSDLEKRAAETARAFRQNLETSGQGNKIILPSDITLSTGDIRRDYQIIGPVFAYGSSNDGFLKTANPMEAYAKVADFLKERAKQMGGNGVIYATFDYRVAAKIGCFGGQAFEVFAYGTAVYLKQ